jgi:uracil-DNA glycosylase
MQNIFREATADIGFESPGQEHWARQVVLLLNTVLTVRRGEANSHAQRWWEDFTDSVVQELNASGRVWYFCFGGTPPPKRLVGLIQASTPLFAYLIHPRWVRGRPIHPFWDPSISAERMRPLSK